MNGRTPYVTLALISLNLAAAVWVFLDPSVIARFGFDAVHPSLISAVMCMFLHINVIHLLGNMLYLAAIGPAVEQAAGSLRFLGVFLGGGLVGVAAHWAMNARFTETPSMIGASGAVASCVAYYSVRYWSARVPLLPNVQVPVIGVVAVWLGLQILGAFVSLSTEDPGISYWAHLGGFGFGIILSLLFRVPDAAMRQQQRSEMDELRGRSPAAALAAAEQFLSTHPNDAKALHQAAEAAHALGESVKERQFWVRIVQLEGRNAPTATWARLAECGGVTDLSVIQRMRFADELKDAQPDSARVLLSSVVADAREEENRPDALLALAALEKDLDAAQFQLHIAELFARFPLHPATEVARARGWSP